MSCVFSGANNLNKKNRRITNRRYSRNNCKHLKESLKNWKSRMAKLIFYYCPIECLDGGCQPVADSHPSNQIVLLKKSSQYGMTFKLNETTVN